MCSECIISSHHYHKYNAVETSLQKQKTELQSMCSVLKRALPCLSRADSESKDVMNGIDSHLLNVRREIEDLFQVLWQQ